MQVTGSLSEFSWSDLLRFLDQTQKSGRLILRGASGSGIQTTIMQYVWFEKGCVLATARQLQGQGLLRLVHQRGWLGYHTSSRLAQTCPKEAPLGLYLKSQGVLSAAQLQLLFQVQVMEAMPTLAELQEGQFQLDTAAPQPMLEMTGLRLPIYEVLSAGWQDSLGQRAPQVPVDDAVKPRAGLGRSSRSANSSAASFALTH